MTHATRTLESHDLLGEGTKLGSHTYFFDHTRTWRASPDKGSANCQGHLRDNTNMKDDTHYSRIHSNNADEKVDYDDKILGEPWGPKAF